MEWYTALATFAPLVITVLGFVFTHIFTKELRQGLKELRNIQRKADQGIADANGDFFREILSPNVKKGKINVYFDFLPEKKRGRIRVRQELKRSYLIVGESGCGKSTFLYQDYLRQTSSLFDTVFPFFHPVKWLTSFSLYLSANDLIKLDEETIKKISEKCSELPIRHARLYLDGLDEMGDKFESQRILIENLIRAMKLAKECEVKIACRRNFALKHSCSDLFSAGQFSSGYDLLEVEYWDSEALEEISKIVLANHNLRKSLKSQSDDILKKSEKWIKLFYDKLKNNKKAVFKDSSSVDKCLINSPLLLMLFLYVNLFTPSEISLSERISKYSMYSRFINALGASSGANQKEIDKEKKEIAHLSFEHYSQLYSNGSSRIVSENQTNLNGVRYLMKLIKNPKFRAGEISFIHYSFFDYFIAYRYQLVVFGEKIQPDEYIEVLGVDYQNEISDFITEAIENRKPNDEIASKLKEVYSLLMANKDKTANFSSIKSFLVKKEIAFRLGRLWYSSKQAREDVSAFLKKIYYDDHYTYDNDNDREIHLAMLKRWIAIAGSLMNTEDGEEIELDFIKKMICNPYENNIADLANRSQTLVFYGDVTGVSSLDYRDDASETKCDNAIRKRVNRLRNINDESYFTLLNKNLNPRENELKNYCFRAFDLASIYCLLRFHKGNNKMLVEELKKGKPSLKIRDVRITFENANAERERIMKSLLNALSNERLPEFINV